jgi:glycosyltransferase involved in cell wall biosynthesis
MINTITKKSDAILDLVASFQNPPKSDRPIVWTEPWYRDGYNNIRYTSLLPRLKSVKTIYQFRYQTGWRGRLWKAYDQSIPGRYWTRGISYSYRLRLLGKQHKTLLCTGHLDKIRHFPGWVIVDEDDPSFSQDRMDLLNHPNVAVVVTSSELLRNKLIEHGLRKPCQVIPSGVDFSQINPIVVQKLSNQYGKGPEDIVVGYAIPEILTDEDPQVIHSEGEKLRSVSFLFEVMERVWMDKPDVYLWLIGNPSRSVIAWASAHPKVRLLGYVPHQELLNYIANFDIAVYPRRIDFGGRHSIKLLEFMACSCPIVSTSVSESFQVVESACGLFANDINSFAICILQLARNPELRHKLGRYGLEYAKNFDWNVIAQRYENDVIVPFLEKLSVDKF